MPTKNTKPSESLISLLFGRPMQPTAPLYWRSRRELPTGLSAATSPERHRSTPGAPGRRGAMVLSLAGRSTYGLPHWTATPEGYRGVDVLRWEARAGQVR